MYMLNSRGVNSNALIYEIDENVVNVRLFTSRPGGKPEVDRGNETAAS